MTIAGIDLSTHAVDIVKLDESTDAATWHRFDLTGDNAFDRARNVRQAMPGSLFWDDVLAIGIEEPRGFGAGSIYRVQGAILAKLPPDVLVHPLIGSSWRKTVGLPGNASKGDVNDFAHMRSGWWEGEEPPWPQDACDAYCIALATRTLIQVTA